MAEKMEQARQSPRKAPTLERGINMDVLGRAIIAQADERIRWHSAKPSSPDDLKEHLRLLSRRTDLESKIGRHLEYARFLTFVRQNIVRGRRYRLGLTDMSMLEIMPKGTYW